MATKLKNLKIKKVDFVDNGANPGASIALYKSKPAEGKTPAVQPKEDTPPEESILKRIVHAIAKSIGATDAQAAAAVEEVSKNADVPTFGDAMARRRMRQTTEEIWDYCYALNDSLCGIVANADITAEDKKALMAQSCAEFAAATEAAIPKWSGGIPVKLEKAAPDTRQNRERQSSPRPSGRDDLQGGAEAHDRRYTAGAPERGHRPDASR